jgi:lipopolysaccharide export system protein LptC
MKHFDNTHSRAVAWAKIVLPLAALVLLSVLFLFSGKVDTSDPLPYATVDIEELAREPRLGAPEFSGLTRDGSALTVSASEARADEDGAPKAHALAATLESPNGFSAQLSSKSGQIDPTTGAIMLEGDVALQTSSGYRLETQQMLGGTSDGAFVSPGEITGAAPFGTLSAGAMSLTPDGDTPEATTHVLRFTKGVKLVYDPAK